MFPLNPHLRSTPQYKYTPLDCRNAWVLCGRVLRVHRWLFQITKMGLCNNSASCVTTSPSLKEIAHSKRESFQKRAESRFRWTETLHQEDRILVLYKGQNASSIFAIKLCFSKLFREMKELKYSPLCYNNYTIKPWPLIYFNFSNLTIKKIIPGRLHRWIELLGRETDFQTISPSWDQVHSAWKLSLEEFLLVYLKRYDVLAVHLFELGGERMRKNCIQKLAPNS